MLLQSRTKMGGDQNINARFLFLSMTSKPQPVAVETPTQGEASYEETHVHKVYEEIAGHFSETRYKVCVPLYIQTTFLTRSGSHGQSSRHSFIVCLLEV